MVNELQIAFNEIAEMRALPRDVVLEALQSALVSAYRRDSGASSAQAIEARIDPSTGRARIFVEKEVTDEIFSENTEVTLEKARFYDPEAEIGDMVMVQVEHTTKKFGRIAAQTAKQVILQKIREAERNAIYDEFAGKEGELIMSTVQSMNHSVVTLRLNERTEAILPRAQQIPGERYRPHEKLRIYLMEVKRGTKGPQIVASRSHRNMLRRLLEFEVPEIYNGQVEIKSIAREAGYRSKVAVAALQEGIDPVGACVGMRGIRIQNIVKELHDEKIDVIEWNDDAETFISKALSPARVTGVFLDDDVYSGRTAVVIVPDDQLSLAIGREGQNARLAAKLTGWRIDIKSVTETVTGALENMDLPPLDEVAVKYGSLVDDVTAIMQKKDEGKAIMPEDYNILGKFANLVERRLQKLRDDIRYEERQQIKAVRATLPEALFSVPVDVLGLDEAITNALEPFENVGEVMLSTLADERRLESALEGLSPEALAEVQAALDELMEADVDFDDLIATEDVDEVEVEEASQVEVELIEESEAELESVELIEEEPEEDAEEILLDARGGIIIEDEPVEEVEEEEDAQDDHITMDDLVNSLEFDDDDVLYPATTPNRRRAAGKRRRLVLDEETGEVVAKRRRQRSTDGDDWDEGDS